MMPNLFHDLKAIALDQLSEEIVETLADGKDLRIERIVSTGQASPEGFWYDQEESEWVVLLAGEAGLLLAGEEQVRVLRPGDFINIPAHQKHRVEWTSKETPTLWLAVFYSQ